MTALEKLQFVIRHISPEYLFRFRQDLPKYIFEERTAIGDGNHAQSCLLPNVLMIELGNGDIEARAEAIANFLHDRPLFLEGMGVRQRDVQRHYANGHTEKVKGQKSKIKGETDGDKF